MVIQNLNEHKMSMLENIRKGFCVLEKCQCSHDLYAGLGGSCKLMPSLAFAKRIRVPFLFSVFLIYD